MTRQQSQMMKGVAILLMIFLHLFNQEGNVALCHNLLFIGGTPLVSILSRAANPVAFFPSSAVTVSTGYMRKATGTGGRGLQS